MQTLLVDDHPLIHQIIPAMLRKAIGDHVMVQSAENLEEALDCARRNAQLELILLDLGLPGCTGIEALVRLHERCPEANRSFISGGTGRSSACIRSIERSTPIASHISNGPRSQLKPHRMARSMSRIESAISGAQ